MNTFGYKTTNLVTVDLITQDVQTLARLLGRKSRQHRQSHQSQGERGLNNAMMQVLRFLREHGPQPVPKIARRLEVGRQHIQRTVNDLRERDLVTRLPNPDHQRSWNFELTTAGHFMIENEQQVEPPLFQSDIEIIPTDELETCHKVLSQLRLLMKATPPAPGSEKRPIHRKTPESVFVSVSEQPEPNTPEVSPEITPSEPEEYTGLVINWNAGNIGGTGLKV